MLRKIADGFFLIGVAHVLPSSVAEVREVIRRERPEIVAVELCPYRLAVISGRAAPVESSRRNPFESLLTGMLGFLQEKFARRTGSAVGHEMMVAIEEAKQVGARIELIDRDIRETMEQLNSSMSLVERIRMFLQALAVLLLPPRQADLSRLTEDEVVQHLVEEFRKMSPSAYRVMIEERDEYMAERLSPFLLDRRRVVCVVGAGHLPGLEHRLRETLMEWERRVWWRGSLEWWSA